MSVWAAHVKFFCNETILVHKVVYIQSNFAFSFLNALPNQLVTMQAKVLKIWNVYYIYMAIRIGFINDFTYLLHFYFSGNAKVRKRYVAKIRLSNFFS